MGRAAARIRRRIGSIVRAAQSLSGLSNSSTSTRGSRRTRGCFGDGEAALQVELARILQLAQTTFPDQALVDRAQPPLEGRVHRRAEGDRLAIHRAAGRDHQVRVSDQRLRVDRVLGHHKTGHPGQLAALGVHARQHHRLQAVRGGGLAQALQDPREQVVLEAVVERDLRRRPHDDDRARRVEAQLAEHARIGLEIGQVVLLLQALVRADLAPCAVALQPRRRDRVGHHDRTRQAAVDVVLHRRPLVVEHRRARNPQQRGRHAHVVGAVAERDVEAPAPARARGGVGAGGRIATGELRAQRTSAAERDASPVAFAPRRSPR